jgi:hypothetical protein
MNSDELRLEIVKSVLAAGSENDRRNPIPKCEELFRWITDTPKTDPLDAKKVRASK